MEEAYKILLEEFGCRRDGYILYRTYSERGAYSQVSAKEAAQIIQKNINHLVDFWGLTREQAIEGTTHLLKSGHVKM